MPEATALPLSVSGVVHGFLKHLMNFLWQSFIYSVDFSTLLLGIMKPGLDFVLDLLEFCILRGSNYK